VGSFPGGENGLSFDYSTTPDIFSSLQFGEKIVLLSQAATVIIASLPTLPPTQSQPYTGAKATATARAALQRALDNYKTGQINLLAQFPPSELERSDTRSFGESHASELSNPRSHSIPITPPPKSASPLPIHPSIVSNISSSGTSQAHPIDPATLNQAPAQLPTSPASTGNSSGPSAYHPENDAAPAPPFPTVAETGVPVTTGGTESGPQSGSLHDLRGSSASAPRPSGGLGGPAAVAGAPQAASANTPKFESAEEEKKRLQREDRERILHSQATPTPSAPTAAPTNISSNSRPSNESAEAEKKRLEREERERLLRGNQPKPSDDDLPPYPDV
jgi:hypothetical protein